MHWLPPLIRRSTVWLMAEMPAARYSFAGAMTGSGRGQTTRGLLAEGAFFTGFGGAVTLALAAYMTRLACSRESATACTPGFLDSVLPFAAAGFVAGMTLGALVPLVRWRVLSPLPGLIASAEVYAVVLGWTGVWPVHEPEGFVLATVGLLAWPLASSGEWNRIYRERVDFRQRLRDTRARLRAWHASK